MEITYIFNGTCTNIQGYDVEGVFSVLEAAIRYKLVPADTAKAMFTKAWPIFRERHLEAALVFLAPVLPRTLYPDDRKNDAVAFLVEIWAYDKPFTPSKLPGMHTAWQFLPSDSLRYQPVYLFVG